ncbi:MAG: hypothetical protein GX418_02910 [Clostridiales bacterium]|nr:hypothetical protein [Clostridiales bacterium]
MRRLRRNLWLKPFGCAALAAGLLAACLCPEWLAAGLTAAASAGSAQPAGEGDPDVGSAPANGTAESSDALPYLAVYLINNQKFVEADPGFALLDAFGMLLALLPDDARYAVNAANNGTEPKDSRWLQRVDSDQLKDELANFEAYRKGKRGDMNDIARDIAEMLSGLSATAAQDGRPMIAAILTGQGDIVQRDSFEKVFNSVASPSGGVTVFSYPIGGESGTGTGNVAYIQRRSDGSGGYASPYLASAMDRVKELLKDRMHMKKADATVTQENGEMLVRLPSLPTHGMDSLRILLEGVPADRGASLVTADGVQPVFPLYTMAGSSEGTENRVYELDAAACGAGAELRLAVQGTGNGTAPPAKATETPVKATDSPAQPTEPNAQTADWAQSIPGTAQSDAQAASPTEPPTTLSAAATPATAVEQEEASPPPAQAQVVTGETPAADHLPTASCYYQFQITLTSKPVLLTEEPKKNKPLLVGVVSETEQFADLLARNALHMQPIVRCVGPDGEEQTAVAQYREENGQYAAELTLSRAGTYTLASGVRAADDAQNVCWSQITVTVTVANSKPSPKATAYSAAFLVDDPTGWVEQSMSDDAAAPTGQSLSDGSIPMPVRYGSISLDAAPLFEDEDDPPEALTYGLSQTGDPDTAAFAGTLSLGGSSPDVPALCTVTCDEHTGKVTVQGTDHALNKNSRTFRCYLLARDGEGATTSLPMSITLTSVERLLENIQMNVAVSNEGGQDLSGGHTVHATATMDLSNKPDWLQTLIRERLTVKVWLEKDKTQVSVSGRLNMTRTGDGKWEADLTLPLTGGEYVAVTEASLPGAANNGTLYKASGWTIRNGDASLQVLNVTPGLADSEPAVRQDVLLLNRLGRLEPALSFAMKNYFSSVTAATSYDIRVLDAQNAEVETVRLLDANQQTDTLCVGFDGEQIRKIVRQRDEDLGIKHVVVTVGENAATDSGASVPEASPAEPATASAIQPAESAALPAGEQNAAIAAAEVAVYIGRPGDYTVELRAKNLDSAPAVYRYPLRAVDALWYWLMCAGLAVAALLLLRLLVIAVYRLLLIPYGDAVLSLKLADFPPGAPEVTIPLARWKKRPVALSHLMLNAMLPLVPWLDDQGGSIRIRPTTRFVRLDIPRAAGRALGVATDGERSRGKHSLMPGKAVTLYDRMDHTHALTLTLRLARAAKPDAGNYARMPREAAGTVGPPDTDDD